MLIIEGTDLVGKTTLAHRLLARLDDHVYSHLSRLPKRFDPYWDYCARASKRIVQDRFHMSEPVYAEVRGEETALRPETYRLVDGYLRSQCAFTVVITATESLIKSRWRMGEMYHLDEVLHANGLFAAIVENGALAGYKMDWDVHLHCGSERHPEAPLDITVDMILEQYRQRLLNFNTTMNRRPPEL